MELLEKRIGYSFQNKSLIKTALTHSSYANDGRKAGVSNERLEFLGDSVLSIVVSEYLFRTHETLPEGELTRMRAALVCEKSLCAFARQLELGKYLYLGRGEQNTGGRYRPSVLADAFEAVIAAVYLDGGMEAARAFIMKFVEQEEAAPSDKPFEDYKTRLQEIVQQNPGETLHYQLSGQSGPDHDKRFQVEVFLNSNCIGKGAGRSKKDAEQRAAKEALLLMGYDK